MVGTDQKALAEAVGRAIAKQRMRCGMTQDEVAETHTDPGALVPLWTTSGEVSISTGEDDYDFSFDS